MMLSHIKLSDGVALLRQMTHPSRRPLSEADMIKLTPQEVHDHGLCNKARLHYECHGRDNYRECY
jgi:hypothetical protein